MTSAGPLARSQPFNGFAGGDAVDRILTRFRSGSALVAAALAALTNLAPQIAAIARTLPVSLGSQVANELALLVATAHALLIDTGSIDGENLLQNDETHPHFLVLGIARAASGKLSVQPIEIDRGQIALMDAGRGPWDRLREAVAMCPSVPTDQDLRAVRTSLDAVEARIAIARSRLSIVKARLDLQSSFLRAIVESDPAHSIVHLDSPLDQNGALHMALRARHLLARQPFTIGHANRAAVRTLFEHHASID